MLKPIFYPTKNNQANNVFKKLWQSQSILETKEQIS